MRKSATCVIFFASLLGVTATLPALASGSFSARPPKPPVRGDAMKLDREKYGLGQKVYEGSVMTPDGGDADAQRARLSSLQSKLPSDAAQTKDLVAMAGKLSASQLDALEYFVEQRFSMKK